MHTRSPGAVIKLATVVSAALPLGAYTLDIVKALCMRPLPLSAPSQQLIVRWQPTHRNSETDFSSKLPPCFAPCSPRPMHRRGTSMNMLSSVCFCFHIPSQRPCRYLRVHSHSSCACSTRPSRPQTYRPLSPSTACSMVLAESFSTFCLPRRDTVLIKRSVTSCRPIPQARTQCYFSGALELSFWLSVLTMLGGYVVFCPAPKRPSLQMGAPRDHGRLRQVASCSGPRTIQTKQSISLISVSCGPQKAR